MPKKTDKLKDFDALWNYEDPASTELKFRELLPIAEEAGDATLHAELLTQIARTEGLRGRYEQAHRTLEAAIPLLEKAGPSARVRFLLERGRVYNSSGQRDKSRGFFLDAYEIATKAGLENLAIDAAHMLGIVEPADQSLDWNLKALALAEAAKEPKARDWRGSLLNNIGWIYHDRGDFAVALEHFERALAFRREKDAARPIEIARWCVARCLRSLGRVEEALAHQQQLLADMSEKTDGYVAEEIGECLLALGREAEARPHFAHAHALLSEDQWLGRNEPDRLARLAQLGGLK